MARKTKEQKAREQFISNLDPEVYQPECVTRIEGNPYDGTPTRVHDYDGVSDVNPEHRTQDDEFYAVRRSTNSFGWWHQRFMMGG